VDGARAAKGQQRGPWIVGYSPLIDLRILSKIRQHLSLAHPAADVRLASAHTSEQADGLMRGKLQAGLVILPIREEGLASEGLYKEALVLALPERHPLSAKAAIEITDSHELPLVTMRGDIEPRFGEYLKRISDTARSCSESAPRIRLFTPRAWFSCSCWHSSLRRWPALRAAAADPAQALRSE